MTPQELKNSILQLAIQGKLVEQRADEGSAKELFAQIQAEKQQLIKEGKIKKEKPLPDIAEDEKPFDIPEGWMWVRFGTLIRVIGGVSYSKNDVCKTGLRILRGGNIQNLQVHLDDDDVFLPAQYEDSEKQVCFGDCIVVASTGSKAVIGKAGYIDRNISNTMIGAFLRICRPFLIETAEYVRCIFDGEYYRMHIREMAQGTNINNVKESYITEMCIPLPPLAEQKRIVAKIEELLPYIDRYEQAWSKLESFNKRFPGDMQKAILQMAIQGKLVEQRLEEGTGEELFQQIQAEKQRLIKAGTIKKEKPLTEITEDENPVDIPDSWKWVRLGDVSVFQGGYAYKSTSYVTASNNQVIRLGNVKNNTFLLEDKQVFIPDEVATNTDNYRIREDDILVTMTGTRRKKDYFFTLLVSKDDLLRRNLYINQRVGCFRIFRGIYPKYLLFVLQCDSVKDIIFTKETGTANQGNLGSEDMKQFVYIPLPPLTEQKRIVAKLEEILLQCERLK